MKTILLEIIKKSKLNLTDLTLFAFSGTSISDRIFDISSKDFLRFAKEDLNDDSERGYINSITNSKRAIDCKIDETIELLIGKSNNFNFNNNDFLKYFEFEADIKPKLKLIHSLNLAPTLILSKARNLRNKLEHIYQKPQKTEVKEALDVADLFLRSVNGRLGTVWTDFEIYDDKGDSELSFKFSDKKFDMKLTKAKKIESYQIDESYIEYFALLRLMLSIDDEIEVEETFKILLKQINHVIPSEKVKVYLSK